MDKPVCKQNPIGPECFFGLGDVPCFIDGANAEQRAQMRQALDAADAKEAAAKKADGG